MARFAGEPVNAPRFSGTLVEEEEAVEPEKERSALAMLRDAPLPGPLAAIKGWPGLAESLGRTYYGVKDLATELDDEDRARLAALRSASDEMGGWGTAGRIGGEIAQMAVPGSAAVKGAKALSAATNAGRTMSIINPLLAEALVAAGFSGIQLPEDNETRGEQATESAIASMAGAALGLPLRILGAGIKKSDEAAKLLDEGVYLTPGMVTDSPALRGLENAAEVTPFLARGTKKAREAAQESFNAAALRNAVPDQYVDDVTDIGTAGGAQIKEAVEKGYREAWGEVEIPAAQMASMYRYAQEAAENFGKKGARVLKNIQDDIERGVDIQQLDKSMREALSSTAARKDPRLTAAIRSLREDLRSNLPEVNQEALRVMDSNYPDYLTVRKAISKAAEGGGEFTPRQLMQSSRQVGGEAQTAAGNAPLQDFAAAGIDTIDTKVGGQPLEWFRRLAGAAPSPPGMRGAGQILTGQTEVQKQALTPGYNYLEELLRGYVSPARVGAAYEE